MAQLRAAARGESDARGLTARASPLGPCMCAWRWAGPTCSGRGLWPASWPQLYKGLPHTLVSQPSRQSTARACPLPQFTLNRPGLTNTSCIPSHITPTQTGLMGKASGLRMCQALPGIGREMGCSLGSPPLCVLQVLSAGRVPWNTNWETVGKNYKDPPSCLILTH